MINVFDSHPSIIAIKENMTFDVNDFKMCTVTVDYVFRLLEALDIWKATGYDKIPAKLVKLGSVALAQPLTDLINMSIEQNVFPDPLKLAELSPSFKKDNDLEKENYRPLSILTIFSKIFERCYSEQLSAYFEKKFSIYLSAYRRRYSCQSTLLRIVE